MDIFSVFGPGGQISVGQRLLRQSGRVMSQVAPGLACSIAAWLWSRPPKAVRSGWLPADAEPITLNMEGRIAQGLCWAGRGQEAPRILVQHGWGSSVAKMMPVIEALVDAGACVVAFDAFRHGRTGAGRHGWQQSSLIELSDVMIALAREFGPFDGLLAHSAAAAAAARSMRQGMRVERAVFLAPLVAPLRQAPQLSHALGLTPEVDHRWPKVLLARFGATHADIDMLNVPRAENLPQVLIVQDQDDVLSPADDAMRLRDAWDGAQLMQTQGLGHNRLCRDVKVLRLAVDFLTAGATVQPSAPTSKRQKVPAPAERGL